MMMATTLSPLCVNKGNILTTTTTNKITSDDNDYDDETRTVVSSSSSSSLPHTCERKEKSKNSLYAMSSLTHSLTHSRCKDIALYALKERRKRRKNYNQVTTTTTTIWSLLSTYRNISIITTTPLE